MSKAEHQYAIAERFLDQPYLLAGRLIDPLSGTLSWQGKREHLRRKELEVLALLASAEGKQVTRDNFIAVVWQGNDLVGDRGLTNTMVFLRRSLRDEDADQPLIRTIPRRGYQLGVPVQRPEPLDQQASLQGEQPVLVVGASIPESPGWRLLRRLSESPLSESWLAEPSEFGEREQVQRVFRFCRSEAYLQRLRREVTLLRYLSQNLSERDDIVLIRDWQLEEPPYYLACDYANGGNLHDCIQAGALPKAPEQRLMLMQGLAEALAAVHALGVVHRRLSAQTVLVDQREFGLRLLLSAFDLGALSDRSKLAPLGITAAGLTLNPDESAISATTADDVYALGLVLLQLALGDVQAQPTPAYLGQVSHATLRAQLEQCFAPAEARHTAAELALQLGGISSSESVELDQNAAVIPSASEVPLATPALKTTPPSNLPETIGPYRLLDRLGEGGMGSVYLAEQREPFRKVALKIIRSGLDGKQILSRFEAERQALALMNHPNVTTVLDSGLATDGRPYFAMEYVQGNDITTYCDARHLSLPARIKLFLQVCDGVLHAHQKGVLHRDIKPSNLMVGEATESAGTVKIIDFGLAKSLHGKLAAQTLHTSFGAFIGTPVYCSPEHISGSAAGVDTRSDIYSMGVVLYELLTGTTPISSESLENLEPEKIREIVCKSKLRSMGEQLLNTSAEKRKELAEHRAVKADELPKKLQGDLSWVVGKCLERDPIDRYASVLELKKDLQRWLELRPVEARPTSSWYRFRKLVRRNRLNTSLACMILSLLIATTTEAVVGFVKAERSAGLARAAADQAQQMLHFQQQQWEGLNPESMGIHLRERLNQAISQSMPAEVTGSLTPTHLLDQVNFTDLVIQQLRDDYFENALKRLQQDYAQRPELEHFLMQSMAETLQTLGIHDRALQLQELALRRRQTLFGPDNELSLQSLFHRGQIQSALAQEVAARADFKKVYERLVAKYPNDHPDVVLARFSAVQHDAVPGDPVLVYRETLAQRLASHGAQDIWAHRMRIALAYALTYRGQHSEAMAVMEEQVGGEPQDFTAKRRYQVETLTTMGTIARRSGDIFAATRYFKQALDAAIQVYGSTHSVTLEAANALAYGLMYSGRAAEGEALMRKTQSDWRAIHGAANPWTIWFESIIADAAWMQGRLDEATELMGTCAKSISPKHSMWFSIVLYHGMFLRDTGSLDVARTVLKAAINTKDQQDRAWAQTELGRLEHLAGNPKLAEELLNKALTALQSEESGDSFGSDRAASYLGAVWKDVGKIDQARRLLEKTWPKQYPWEAIATIRTLAVLEHEQGNQAKALAHAQKALALGRKHLDPRSREWTQLKSTLASIESMRSR
jgi:eukaryotic-like serine/threonine-protein kinase